MRNDIISTWIYLDRPEEQSEYPQVGKSSHSAEFQKIYWRCVAVFFEWSTRHNPTRRHLLFSNWRAEQFPVIDGLDLRAFLLEKNVEVVTLPLTWQTPPGWFGRWRNQFYIFDILSFFEKRFAQADSGSDSKSDPELPPTLVVLDSDCLINRPLDELFAAVRRDGLLTLPMPYEVDFDINGVTRRDLRQLYTELDDNRDPGQEPIYYGGEIFAATLPVVQRINALAPDIWREMHTRFERGAKKFNEEAHFLSYCYHRIGSFGSLEGFIKRIWTAPHFSNVQPADADLPIWHLPSEKTGGIALLFRRFIRPNGRRALPNDAKTLAAYVGLTQPRLYVNWKHRLRHSWIYKMLAT